MPTSPIDLPAPRPIIDSATLFGRCLACVRRDLGLTQEEFAASIGLTRPGLARIEGGRATPSYYVLMRMGQRIRPRRGADAASIITLVYLSATAFRRRGVRVVNRPRAPGDAILSIAQIDRVIGAVYDAEFGAIRDRPITDAFPDGDAVEGGAET